MSDTSSQNLSNLGSLEIKRLRARLLSHARLKLNSSHDAEDVVQQALMAALEGRAPYAGGSLFVGWLVGILKYKIVDETRRQIKGRADHFEERVGCRSTFEERLETTSIAAAPVFRCPSQELELSRFFNVLAEAVAELSPTAAQIFVLRDVEGASVTHICASLGVSKTNCGVILYRARRKLRATLTVRGYGLER